MSRSTGTMRELANAVMVVEHALNDLPKESTGEATMDECQLSGIMTLLSLIGGELEAAHEQEENESIMRHDAEEFRRLSSIRSKYYMERRMTLTRMADGTTA